MSKKEEKEKEEILEEEETSFLEKYEPIAELLSQIELRRVYKLKQDKCKILAIMDVLKMGGMTKDGRMKGFGHLITFLVNEKYQEIALKNEIFKLREEQVLS